jgi:hypothetical protein
MGNELLIKNTARLFSEKLKVINVGLPHFAETLREQGIEVEQVDWKPIAEGDKDLAQLLDSMGIDD